MDLEFVMHYKTNHATVTSSCVPDTITKCPVVVLYSTASVDQHAHYYLTELFHEDPLVIVSPKKNLNFL